MKKFIRLLSFEMNRFLKFLVPVLLISGAVQLFVTFFVSFSYNNELERLMASGESLEQFPPLIIHNITSHTLYELSIMLIILIFMVYSFFTWYREWLGKNTFVYRLLMLPMDRTHILLTKSAVFLIGGLLAFVFQFGMYFIELQIVETLVSESHYIPLNIHNVQRMYGTIQYELFPTSPFEFLSTYSFAFGALLSLFVGILIERSFELRGLIVGVIYFLGYFIIYGSLSLGLHTADLAASLLPSQIELILLAYQFLMIGIGIAIGRFLLKNKVKV